METRFITVRGINIRYLRVNEKASNVLLILHGWSSSIDSWFNIVDGLEQVSSLQTIILDLPGFGQSGFPSGSWQVKDYSLFVNDFVKTLGVKKMSLLGHSFGGQIAVQYAIDFPEHLDTLILCGAAAIRPQPNFFTRCIKMLAKAFKFFIPVQLRQSLYRLGNLDYGKIDNSLLKEIFSTVIREDLSELLPKIKTPTVIIWGRGDTYTPLKNGLKIHRLIPHSQLHILENARHGIHLQQPAALLKLIKTALLNNE